MIAISYVMFVLQVVLFFVVAFLVICSNWFTCLGFFFRSGRVPEHSIVRHKTVQAQGFLVQLARKEQVRKSCFVFFLYFCAIHIPPSNVVQVGRSLRSDLGSGKSLVDRSFLTEFARISI